MFDLGLWFLAWRDKHLCFNFFYLPYFETTFTQRKERANIATEVWIPTEPRRHSDHRFDKERDGLDGVCWGRAWGCLLASLLTDSFCLKCFCSRQLIRTRICIELTKFVIRLLPFSSPTDAPPFATRQQHTNPTQLSTVGLFSMILQNIADAFIWR